MSLMSYSGGLRYHGRALRYARGLWTSHREGVRSWLGEWNPRARDLILVGPSGGYSLPREWLARFDSVTVVDPDPVARAIWKTRGARTLARADLLQADRLREFLAHVPEARERRESAPWPVGPARAILFCNVLGQLEWLLNRSDADARAYFQALEDALGGHEWASYHDRVSGELVPRGEARSDRALTNEELLARFELPAGSGETVLADHSTGQLAPSLPRRYWVWELRPGHYHLIEGIYFRPTT